MTAQEFFKNDLFAENAGVVLLEVRKGYSKAKLEIKPEHLNAGARTQGGAIFTLADLALAAAANSHGTLAFSLSSTITFLRASGPGDTLFAEARERYIGRSTVGLTTSSVYSAFAPLYSTTYVYSPATFVSSLAVLAFT